MKGSHPEAIQEIKAKSVKFSDSKVKMFPDHVKVIGDGAFFSQLMQMRDGYLDGHQVSHKCSEDPSVISRKVYRVNGSRRQMSPRTQ